MNIPDSVTGGKCQKLPQYLETIRRTKVCVSPWGYGEWCFRDFEAYLSQSVLIKPRTDFVKMLPDIFNKSEFFYLECEPDLSDLSQVVDSALSRFEELEPKLAQNRKNILEFMNPTKLASNFHKAVLDSLSEYQSS